MDAQLFYSFDTQCLFYFWGARFGANTGQKLSKSRNYYSVWYIKRLVKSFSERKNERHVLDKCQKAVRKWGWLSEFYFSSPEKAIVKFNGKFYYYIQQNFKLKQSRWARALHAQAKYITKSKRASYARCMNYTCLTRACKTRWSKDGC